MNKITGMLGAAAVLGFGLAYAQESADPSFDAYSEAPADEAMAKEDTSAAPAEEMSAEAPAEAMAAEAPADAEATDASSEAPADAMAVDSFTATEETAAVESAPVETYEAPVEAPVEEFATVESEAVSEPAEPTARDQKYLAVMGTGTDADKDRSKLSGANIDYGAGLSFLYGWQSASQWGFEVQGFTETFETDTTLRTDFYRYGANLDLFYAFGDRTSFTPFLLIGVGGNYNDVFPQEDDFTYFANAGVGFVTGPVIETGNIRLRGEARYIYDDFEDGYGDIRYALGIEIPLFAEPEIEVADVVEQVQVVQVTGLQDSDGDGVVDDKDQCPDTPAGERVDGVGCPLGKVIALNGVTFEFNLTRLRPDAQTILDLATDILKKYPDMQVEVAGHTDSIGGDAYNQTLSEGRAAAVRDYFVEKGVTNTLTVKGYGEAEPVADNDSEEGRERNRRVELRILN